MAYTTHALEHFGLEIRGLDISGPIPDDVQKSLYALWLKHGVLVFKHIGVDAERHVRLAKVFGPLQAHPVPRLRLEGSPEIMLLATEKDTVPAQYVDEELRRGFIYWHSDMSYVPDINKGSLLRCLVIPERGGDTLWCDTALAYDDLSADMKATVDKMSTIQTVRGASPRAWGWPELSLRVALEFQQEAIPPFPLVVQPLVITHQESGIKSLMPSPLGYVRIDGMGQKESDEFFEQLCRHALNPKYRYHHKWDVGDMVLWDNRRTMHCALGYPVGLRREMQRATLAEVQNTGRLYEPAIAA